MKRNKSRIAITLSAGALFASFVLADFPTGRAVAKKSDPATVLKRRRFGGYIEETTLITKGPHANHIAMTNGAEVLAVPINANSDGAIKRIFDSRAVGWEVHPKGMAFIESEQAFVFVEGANPTKLYLADRTGKALPTRTITYLPEPLNELHNEGLIYLPQSSPIYPDHILMIANRFPPVDPFIESSIEILTRDGQVVAKIIPPSPLRENYLTGICLRGTNQLLIGLNNQLWTIDFDGNLISGPVETPGPYVEGVEQLPDGRFVISVVERLYF